MPQNLPTPPASKADAPTDAQLRAAIYFAVGATEGGAYARELRHIDKGKSGYTVGVMQIDLGQRNGVIPLLTAAYQDWASQQPSHPSGLTSDTLAWLARDRDAIRSHGGDRMNKAQKDQINAFLASDAGQTWTYQQDMLQVDKLMKEAVDGRMKKTRLYQSATPDDQIRLAVIAAKAYNQSEVGGRRAIDKANEEDINTVDAFINRVKSTPTITHLVREVTPNALHAANLVVALNHASATNPLTPLWQKMVVDQQQPSRTFGPEYVTIRNLFIHYEGDKHQERAKAFIDALDKGQLYPSNITQDRRMSLVSDGHNLVTLDRDYGHAQQGYARLNGAWIDVSSDKGHLGWAKDAGSRNLEWQPRQGEPQTLLQMAVSQSQIKQPRAHEQEHKPKVDHKHELPPPSQHQPQIKPPLTHHHRTSMQEDDPARTFQMRAQASAPNHFPTNHRDFAMFKTIQANLPKDTPDETVALAVLQAKQAHIFTNEELREMYIQDNRLFITGELPYSMSSTDLTQRAPPLDQTLPQIEAINQQRDHQAQQYAQQRAQELAQGPSMGMRM